MPGDISEAAGDFPEQLTSGKGKHIIGLLMGRGGPNQAKDIPWHER